MANCLAPVVLREAEPSKFNWMISMSGASGSESRSTDCSCCSARHSPQHAYARGVAVTKEKHVQPAELAWQETPKAALDGNVLPSDVQQAMRDLKGWLGGDEVSSLLRTALSNIVR